MPQEQVFAYVKTAGCYHSNPACPSLVAVTKRFRVHVIQYKDEKQAIAGGHFRRCKMCMGSRVFQKPGNPKEVIRLSEAQYGILAGTRKACMKFGGPVRIRDVAAARNKSIVATYITMQALLRMGLIEHELPQDKPRAKHRSLRISEMGMAILASDPVDEIHGVS